MNKYKMWAGKREYGSSAVKLNCAVVWLWSLRFKRPPLRLRKLTLRVDEVEVKQVAPDLRVVGVVEPQVVSATLCGETAG